MKNVKLNNKTQSTTVIHRNKKKYNRKRDINKGARMVWYN